MQLHKLQHVEAQPQSCRAARVVIVVSNTTIIACIVIHRTSIHIITKNVRQQHLQQLNCNANITLHINSNASINNINTVIITLCHQSQQHSHQMQQHQ